MKEKRKFLVLRSQFSISKSKDKKSKNSKNLKRRTIETLTSSNKELDKRILTQYEPEIQKLPEILKEINIQRQNLKNYNEESTDKESKERKISKKR